MDLQFQLHGRWSHRVGHSGHALEFRILGASLGFAGILLGCRATGLRLGLSGLLFLPFARVTLALFTALCMVIDRILSPRSIKEERGSFGMGLLLSKHPIPHA